MYRYGYYFDQCGHGKLDAAKVMLEEAKEKTSLLPF